MQLETKAAKISWKEVPEIAGLCQVYRYSQKHIPIRYAGLRISDSSVLWGFIFQQAEVFPLVGMTTMMASCVRNKLIKSGFCHCAL